MQPSSTGLTPQTECVRGTKKYGDMSEQHGLLGWTNTEQASRMAGLRRVPGAQQTCRGNKLGACVIGTSWVSKVSLQSLGLVFLESTGRMTVVILVTKARLSKCTGCMKQSKQGLGEERVALPGRACT